MRPFAALFFGYIGDFIGRKATVTITTMIMAVSCIIMANLPTYAQIGISAAWLVTLCRIIQGFSSLGGVIGAEIYLTEITKPPARYPAVSFIAVSCALGSMAAIALAAFVTIGGLNWRIAFLIGALIAIVGSIARTKLRETPDFADAKRRIKNTKVKTGKSKVQSVEQEKVSQKTSLALFLMDCMWPLCFYFSYVYCGSVLKNSFNFTSEQIIHQNFIVSLVQIVSLLLFVFLIA
jgi:MFS family permease